MPDLGKTDAQWDRLLQREFALCCLGPLRFLREALDRFGQSRTQVRVVNDVDANVDALGVTLSGVDTGTNTAPDGRLYVRITGSGPYTVTLYTAAGASGEVASGSGNADTNITLSASNSSGLTGTFDLAASVTATTDDSLQLEAVLDFPALLPKVFTQADGIDDDKDSRRVLQQMYDEVESILASAIGAVERGVAAFLLGDAANPTGRGNSFATSNETALGAESPNTDSSGNVSRLRTGLFERLRLSMAEETTGSTQYVVKRTPSAAAAVAASTNSGAGAIASHTPQEKAQAGTLTLRCTSDEVGAETFGGYFYMEDSDRRTPVSGLRVGKAWSGPLGLGPITLTRTLSKTGDGSNTELGAATGITVTGENAANTNDGVLYWRVDANSSNWDVSFFSASSRAASTLVAKATNVATAASFTATAQNGSGLTVTGTVGSGPTDTTTGTLDLQVFKVENANGVPDEFTIAVTVAAGAGLVQTMLSQHFAPNGVQLNSTTSGSETLDDDYARANTFSAFSVEDN